MKTKYHAKFKVVIVAMTTLVSVGLNVQAGAAPNAGTNNYPTDYRQLAFDEVNYYRSRLGAHESVVECTSADHDLEGNWGIPADGLQLSLRFRRKEYLVGEPIPALILLRNLTTAPRRLEGNWRGAENDFEFTLHGGTNATPQVKPAVKATDYPHYMAGPDMLPSQTQRATVVQINELFRFDQLGEYFLVLRREEPCLNGGGTTNIVSGRATFRIVEKLSATEIEARRVFAAKLEAHRKRFVSDHTPPATITNTIPQKTKDN